MRCIHALPFVSLTDSLVCRADEAEEVRKLGMGRLLADVSTKMQKKAINGPKDQMRILVHSTHDTTIAGICATLDVFDERCVAP